MVLKPEGQPPQIGAAVWLVTFISLANFQRPGKVCISASQDVKKYYSELRQMLLPAN
jgi:hypothetical protein